MTNLALELLDAYLNRAEVAVPPSGRDAAFDLDAAYAVEAEFARLRLRSGAKFAGRKVGYANKAAWRILKLETLVWAHMYDDTVQYGGELAASRFRSPRIEPEIVFKLKTPDEVEWVALGFEIIDCPFPGWEFQPVDFVAAYGLHSVLVVGEPRPFSPEIENELATFKLRLMKNGELIEEGSGKNSLRSPALCLAELRNAAARRGDPLTSGELVSSGTLTKAQAVAGGEVWRAELDGLALPNFELRFF